MAVVEIGILGPVRCRFGHFETAPSGAKLRSILSILALHAGEQVDRDRLIEDLGLFRTTGDSLNALQAHIARLRRWLRTQGGRPEWLETVHCGYRLDLDRQSVDAHRFTGLVDGALKLAPTAPSDAETMLEKALGLWRGDPLLDAPQGPLVSAAVYELHQLRSAARETLVETWVSLGNDQKVISHARKFIADDPLNEKLWNRQIVVLHRRGRIAEAVECYRSATRVLNKEPGIAPDIEFDTAFSEIPADLR